MKAAAGDAGCWPIHTSKKQRNSFLDVDIQTYGAEQVGMAEGRTRIFTHSAWVEVLVFVWASWDFTGWLQEYKATTMLESCQR